VSDKPDPQSEPMSAVDYAWLRMDEPANLMIINGVLVLDEPVDFERLRSVVEHRLAVLPRFRQRVVLRKRKPYWEPDAAFDLDAHLQRLRLPEPGDEAALRQVLDGLISSPLDPDRPLWSLHLLEGFNGGSVLFGKIHHCIGDGVALLMVVLSLTDLTPGPSEVPNPVTGLLRRDEGEVHTARELVEQVMPDAMRLLEMPVEALRRTATWIKGLGSVAAFARLALRPADPKTIFKGPLQIEKRVAWSDAVPVEEVKAIGRALGGTVNDVLLTAVAGGMRRYLERRGKTVHGRLSFRAAMPVNLRPLEKMARLGNEFGLIFLSLPAGIVDPAARLAELRRRASALKRSLEPVVVYRVLQLLGMTPLVVQKIVVRIFGTKATAVMTNVPGPRETLYLAGKPVREIFFWVPQSGRVGLGISIFSYAGHVRMGLASDAGLVPDPEAIVRGFHEEFEELRARAARQPQGYKRT
jgi:diacylglycerol O-acyltransferase / wax synthase